MKLYNKAQPWR